jgi:hypothetical protein
VRPHVGGQNHVGHSLAHTPPDRRPAPTHGAGGLTARIDRLPAAAKALLQTLAVIGPTCSLTLRQVVETPADVLRQRLMALQRAELLYERPTFPEPEYTCKHAMTQEVAYTTLPRTRRWEVHERTAQGSMACLATGRTLGGSAVCPCGGRQPSHAGT